MLSNLPITRSSPVRVLFFATAIVTIAILMWLVHLRASGELRGLTPIFFVLFTFFDYSAAMCALLILLAAMFLSGRGELPRVLLWVGGYPVRVALASTFVLCLGALFVYHNHPLCMDEYAPFFQSQAFAAGKLTGQLPVSMLDFLIPNGFQSSFLSVSSVTGQVVSGYWPSFALLLTPFTWLGIPWACNPVLSGLTLIAIHRLALRLFDSVEAAGLAVLLTIASPVFFANGISYYSMTAHMLANIVFALLVLQATPRRLLAAGIIGSIALTLHNPVPHILFAAPWCIWLATRPRPARNLAWLAAGYLPLCVLLGVGWFWFQGDLMRQGASSAADSVARVSAVFAFPSETVLLARLVGFAKVWLWAVPGIVLLACWGAWKCRNDVRIRLLAASALTTLIGYLFVLPDQGHGWGFRYFHSAWFALPILAAAALTRNSASVQQEATTPGRDIQAFVVALSLLMLVVGVPFRGMQIRTFMDDHLAQAPGYAGTEPRIIIIDPTGSFYGYDLVQNHPLLKGDVIRLISQGDPQNARAVRELRPNYRLVYADSRGEVWSMAAPDPGLSRAKAALTKLHEQSQSPPPDGNTGQ